MGRSIDLLSFSSQVWGITRHVLLGSSIWLPWRFILSLMPVNALPFQEKPLYVGSESDNLALSSLLRCRFVHAKRSLLSHPPGASPASLPLGLAPSAPWHWSPNMLTPGKPSSTTTQWDTAGSCRHFAVLAQLGVFPLLPTPTQQHWNPALRACCGLGFPIHHNYFCLQFSSATIQRDFSKGGGWVSLLARFQVGLCFSWAICPLLVSLSNLLQSIFFPHWSHLVYLLFCWITPLDKAWWSKYQRQTQKTSGVCFSLQPIHHFKMYFRLNW